MSRKLRTKDVETLIYLAIIVFPIYGILLLFQNYGRAIGYSIVFLFVFTALVYILIFSFEYFYYKSEKFLAIKNSIEANTLKCNELNAHIEELKQVSIVRKAVDFGIADYYDNSKYNYQRKELEKIDSNLNVYNCSLSVCKGAQERPFKYLCKYFNVKADEDTLSDIENAFNDFSAAEQGKSLLKKERTDIVDSIKNLLPIFLLKFRQKKLIKKLGFDDLDFSDCYFPKYTFNYVSAGGNSSMSCDILLNVENLEKFILYLSDIIKFRKSIAGQRMLMTSSLREKIKKRDKYQCKHCGASIAQEPNLLLEIDHILPLSKGGITSEDNLQTLCWRCNRKKGNKILSDEN